MQIVRDTSLLDEHRDGTTWHDKAGAVAVVDAVAVGGALAAQPTGTATGAGEVIALPSANADVVTPAGSTSPAGVSSRARRWLPRVSVPRRGGEHAMNGPAAVVAGDAVLEMMLLRDENLRLKSERHRPADLGVLIEQLRLAAGLDLDVEDLDHGWTLLADCHTVREALRQAELEVATAITSLKARLSQFDGEPEHLAFLGRGDHGPASDAA